VTIRFGGDPGKYKPTAMTISLLKGLLSPICGDTVNFVNAPSVAKERGISVTESRSDEKTDFTSYIEVEVESGKEKNCIMGTLFEGMARIVRINEFQVDVEPNGTILFIKNEDRPGVVGKVGTLLGSAKVNIAEMSLGRIRQGKKTLAMTVINTDGEIPEKVVKQLQKFDPVIDVKVTRL
jgi:D-3-phosphoglycerate dehydrogenase